MWGNGFSERASFRDGILEKMDRLILCYFVMVIRGWGRLILGNTRYRDGDLRSLTTWDSSSLVIDHFYGSGQDTTVTGLYCDYLDRKEQTTSNMLGAMLKQLVGRGNIPKDIRKQCSQRSGAPVGPGGGTAKSPGPDGTAKCGPHPS